MKTKSILLLLSFALMHSTCQKSLEYDELIYIGSWSSKKFYFEIGANGYGYIERGGLFGFAGEEGRVKIRRDKIIFITENHRKSFRIDQDPFYDPWIDQIIMILDGNEFYKH